MFSRDAYLIDSHRGSIAVAAIPKCGQHTLEEYKVGYISRDVIHNVDLAMAFIRDPLDRLLSCYHFYHRMKYSLDGCPISCYESFVDWALTAADEHVFPQSKFVCNQFKQLIKIESMSDTLLHLTGRSIEPQNASERLWGVDETYRLSDIEMYYCDDYELRERCAEDLE